MKRLILAGGYSLASVVTQGLSRFLYSILIARFMVPGSLADINTLISIAMFASLLLPASIASAATMFIARARGTGNRALEAETIRFLRQRSVLGSAALGAAAAMYTALVYAPGRIDSALLSFAIVMGFGLSSFVRGTLYARENGGKAAFLDAFALFIAIAGLGAVLALGYTAWALVPLIAGYAVVVVGGWPKADGRSDTPVARGEIDRFIGWGVAAAVATGGFLQLTMIVAQSIGSQRESDLYAAALALATPASMLTSVASLILFPSISRAVGRGDTSSVHRQGDVAMRMLTVMLVGAFGCLVLLGPLLLQLLFGEGFADAAPFLALLLVATLFGAVVGPAVDALSSSTKDGLRLIAYIRLAGFAVGFVTIGLLLPMLGVFGVAVGYLVGMVVSGVGPIALAWRRLNHKWGGIALRFIGGLTLLGGLYAVQQAWGVSLVSVLVTAAAFGCIWGLVALAVMRDVISATRARAADLA